MSSKFKIGDIVRVLPKWQQGKWAGTFRITALRTTKHYEEWGPAYSMEDTASGVYNGAYGDQIELEPFLRRLTEIYEQNKSEI